MTRRRIRYLALAVVALAATGCLDVERDLPPPGVRPVAAAHAGGTLVVAITPPVSIDPALVPPADASGNLVVHTMCDPLLATDPRTGDVVPDLVQTVQPTHDGSVFTLRLRRGMEFADGSAVTAQDVVDSLDRVARPEVASPGAALLRHVFGWSDVQQGKRSADGRLAGLTVVDQRTVQVALDIDDAQWPRVLTTAAGMPVPRRDAGDNGFGTFSTHPACVGPYRIDGSWRPGQPTITLVRSAHYEGGSPAETRDGRGWADRVVFRIYPSRSAALRALRAGEVDLAPADADTIAAARAVRHARVLTAANGTFDYIGLPASVPPFDDPVVRRALAAAVDRSTVATTVFHGAREPMTGVFPPTVGRVVAGAGCGGAAGAAVARHGDARLGRVLLGPKIRLLRGRTFPFYFDDEFANGAETRAVARQWQRAFGVRFRLVGMDFNDFVVKGQQAPGFDGPFRLSYAAPDGSAYTIVDALASASSIGVDNLTRFSDAGLDHALTHEAARATTTTDERQAYTVLALGMCMTVPFVPLLLHDAVWAVRTDRVSSAYPAVLLDRSSGLPLLRELFAR